MPIRQKLATFSTIPSSDLSPDGSQIGRPSSDFPPGSASTALVVPWWTEGPTRLSDKGGDCVRYLCATWPLSAQKCFCMDIKHRYTPELNFDKCGPIHFNQNDQPIWQNTGHCTEEKEWFQTSTFYLIQNLVASFFLCSF